MGCNLGETAGSSLACNLKGLQQFFPYFRLKGTRKYLSHSNHQHKFLSQYKDDCVCEKVNMGSNFLGWNGKGLSSNPSKSSSAKKGKKSGSDKPKQPQRGLGVAQLEKIRLHNQMGCNYLPSAHNPFLPNLSQVDARLQSVYSLPSLTSNFSYAVAPYGFPATQGIMIGLPDADRANRYGDFQPPNAPRCYQGNSGFQQVVEPNITRMFFEIRPEGPLDHHQNVRDASTQNTTESSGSKEIDLELRLSL